MKVAHRVTLTLTSKASAPVRPVPASLELGGEFRAVIPESFPVVVEVWRCGRIELVHG